MDDLIRARTRLTRYLAMRDHSAAELMLKLARYHPPAMIDRVIADAAAAGLLASDEQIARRKIESFARRLKSRRYIEARLREKGLPVPFPGEDDDAVEVAKARELVAGKFGDPLELSIEERGVAFRFLQYRGFEDRHIKRVFSHEE